MKTYTKSDFHNPEQLTRQQVGAEYRLLLKGELLMDPEVMTSKDVWLLVDTSKCDRWTHRVPLATPLPDGTVLSSNECCFSDAPAKPRVYLAGGMTGYVDFNFPAFFKAAAELEQQGYEVINPAQMDLDRGYTLERLKQLTTAEHEQFLKEAVKLDLDAIQTCEAIALLPGWENSKGATAELHVANWLGLDEIHLEPDASVLSEKTQEVADEETWDTSRFDAKLPYNSDERAEWGYAGYGATSTPQYASDDPKGAVGATKAPMDLLPPDALLETAWAMGHGASKYGRWNFIETTVCAHTYIAAIGRHLAKYSKREDVDDESGLHHLAHIAANCYILMTAAQQETLNDDRPKLK